MIIRFRGRPGKATPGPFRPPPWTRTAPQWRQLDEQLEPGHLARLIDQGVDRLDWTPLRQSYAGRGSPPCRPDLMLKIVLFEIQRGRTSPAPEQPYWMAHTVPTRRRQRHQYAVAQTKLDE